MYGTEFALCSILPKQSLHNYDLCTQIDSPDAVISLEISLSSELLLFHSLNFVVDSDACLSTVGKKCFVDKMWPITSKPTSCRQLHVSLFTIPDFDSWLFLQVHTSLCTHTHMIQGLWIVLLQMQNNQNSIFKSETKLWQEKHVSGDNWLVFDHDVMGHIL